MSITVKTTARYAPAPPQRVVAVSALATPVPPEVPSVPDAPPLPPVVTWEDVLNKPDFNALYHLLGLLGQPGYAPPLGSNGRLDPRYLPNDVSAVAKRSYRKLNPSIKLFLHRSF